MTNDREIADSTTAAIEQRVDPVGGSTPVHRTIGETSPSVAVVEAIAEAEGISPLDVSESLSDVVNTDALDQLFESTDGAIRNGRVVFSASGYEVTVAATGDVYVHDG